VKTDPKKDAPSFLADERYDKDHPSPPPTDKTPRWLNQVKALPPECKALQARIESQLKAGPAAIPTLADR
jgi:hypothetical protein